LKLNFDILLSTPAFKVNLRRYNEDEHEGEGEGEGEGEDEVGGAG
jgi:hypothetical protein